MINCIIKKPQEIQSAAVVLMSILQSGAIKLLLSKVGDKLSTRFANQQLSIKVMFGYGYCRKVEPCPLVTRPPFLKLIREFNPIHVFNLLIEVKMCQIKSIAYLLNHIFSALLDPLIHCL